MKNEKYNLGILGALLIAACSGATGGATSTATVGTSGTAAAVSAIFSGITANNNLAGSTKTLSSSQNICNNLRSGPSKVLQFGYGGPSSRTYGSASDSITVSPNDFCEDATYTALTGDASVGGNRFALFSLFDSITGSCTSGGTAGTMTMLRGSGIARNTDSYLPEIYGRFDIDGTTLDCTLRMDSTGAINTTVSSCTDAAGASVDMATNMSCTMNTARTRATIPTTIKGHYAVTTDTGSNVASACWAITPFVVSDGFISVTSDCTSFGYYGFNLSSFNVNVVVNSSGTIYYTTNRDVLANRIKMMHKYGYPVFLSIDMLYSASYSGLSTDTVDDTANFPQTLVDDATFQSTLSTEITTMAEFAENLGVEMFAPLSEADRIFSQSATTNAVSTYLQSLRPRIEASYSGALVWISQFYNSTSTATYDLTGFDYAGVNISPMPDHTSEAAFTSYVQTQLGNLQIIATALGLPYLMTNAGIWGEALTNTYDWNSTPAKVVGAFTIMENESTTYGTSGIIFWEGASGEVVFGDYPTLSAQIATWFGGDPTQF